jgi:hypothetical protein
MFFVSVVITTECVRLPAPKKRTPRSKRAVGDAGRGENDSFCRREIVRVVNFSGR